MRLFFLGIALLIAVVDASACSCAHVEEDVRFAEADAVFIGEVVHFRYSLNMFHATFVVEVSKVWKGVDSKFVTLRSIAPSPIAVCSRSIPMNSEVLLYAQMDDDGYLHATAGGCGASDALQFAQDHLAYLETIPSYSESGLPIEKRPSYLWSDMMYRLVYVPLAIVLYRTRKIGHSELPPNRRHLLSLVWFLGIGVLALLLGNENIFNSIGAGLLATLIFFLGSMWMFYVAPFIVATLVVWFTLVLPVRFLWGLLSRRSAGGCDFRIGQ